MLHKLLTGLFIITIINSCAQNVEISQYRGPNRDGIFHESNLLKKWPEGGPEMLWSYEGLGAGYGNVSFYQDRMFVCGMKDTIGFLYALNMDGKLLWKKEYGVEWYENYKGSRATPTIVDNMLYFESGQAEVFCYNADDGKLIWKVNMYEEFSAKKLRWGIRESLLVNGDVVYCTPGGPEANVVALNRFTGETVWTSRGNGEVSAYCSPILVNHNGTRLLITMTAESVIGIDAATGESYWRIEQRQTNEIHANTPLYYEGKILCSSAWDKTDDTGTAQILLSDDGKSVEVVWRKKEITNLMSGFILKDGFVFGSPYNKSEWYCIDWENGETKYITKAIKSGVIVYADGLFYCYTHQGEMALVDADDKEFTVISSFEVPLGTDPHWAHPVIHKGRMYIRHGDALMVYDIAGSQ
ncbi:PQQ-binding-like beta-propeller repeat protein [Bacteroidota bacterium]